MFYGFYGPYPLLLLASLLFSMYASAKVKRGSPRRASMAPGSSALATMWPSLGVSWAKVQREL